MMRHTVLGWQDRVIASWCPSGDNRLWMRTALQFRKIALVLTLHISRPPSLVQVIANRPGRWGSIDFAIIFANLRATSKWKNRRLRRKDVSI